MDSRWTLGMAGIIAGFMVGAPVSWAADEDAAEAAQVETPEVSVEHIRAAIEAETDPELREAMADQLELLESGQLDFQTLERELALGAPPGPGETSGGFVGPPVDIGTGGGTTGGGTTGDYLPPEAQAELEKIFSQGTGDPSRDGHLREQAEKVFEKYGIDHDRGGMMGYDREGDGGRVGFGEGRQGEMTPPREAFQQWEQSEQGQRTDSATREQYREMSDQYQAEFEQRGGLEQRGEGFERAMTEHMAPEAREQMERFMSERESMERSGMERGGMEREMMEREFGGPSSERETMERGGMEREAMEREFGGSSSEREVESNSREYEAPTHEYEAPTRETEAPTREYEAPTREYEAPTHEYEAPTHEYEAPEATTHEYEAPEASTPEYEAPGSGDGSGMGPH
ncbi:MAG: hypothetical protein Q8R91_04885 [Candidatus Omnitrophota bacterium]|nr:hypothetical protein [Candidatus Omnitrophota bacterium]